MVQEAPPDLVLMDVMMPHVDGFETCRVIKQDPRMRLILIVLVTALNKTPSRINGINAGADHFISKPFNALELQARVLIRGASVARRIPTGRIAMSRFPWSAPR